jgi:hypothetical protein
MGARLSSAIRGGPAGIHPKKNQVNSGCCFCRSQSSENENHLRVERADGGCMPNSGGLAISRGFAA